MVMIIIVIIRILIIIRIIIRRRIIIIGALVQGFRVQSFIA